MADALLRAERPERGEALWAQAAAQLQPRRAAPILTMALMKRYNGQYQNRQRGLLMATLWRLSGESETEFLLNWFWSESVADESAAQGPSAFLEELQRAPAAPTERLLVRLLNDEKLETLPKSSLVSLANLINDWAGQTVFDSYPLYGPENANDAKALAIKRDFIARARAARALWEN